MPTLPVSAPPAERAGAPQATGKLHPDGGGWPQPAAVSRRPGRVHPTDGAHGDSGEVEAHPPSPGPAEEGAAQRSQGQERTMSAIKAHMFYFLIIFLCFITLFYKGIMKY